MEKNVKQVRQVFSLSDIALLLAIAAVSAGFILLGRGWEGVGYIIILCLGSMIPFWKHGYRLNGQKGEFRQEEILVARECKDEILSFLEGKSDTLVHNPRQKGGALVEVYYRKGDGRIFARYFDYADYASGKEYELNEISRDKKVRLEQIEDQSETK